MMSSTAAPRPGPRPNPEAHLATTTTTTTADKTTAPPQPPPKQHPIITPAAVRDHDSLSNRMSVDKNIIDELLLVCGVIGTAVATSDGNQEDEAGDLIVPVTDCLNWLQDLQRALRRDDDQYRPISLLLCDWKVVAQKLLPLVLSCRYDTAIVLTICKILVILTKPLSENTIRAGRMVIDTKKMPPEVVKEQMKLRENALKQAEVILEYKRIICHHSSHHKKDRGNGNGGILSVFVSLLAEPLSKTGTARTDHDHLAIELVLHLFRNLLSAEPLLQSNAEQAFRDQQLHNEIISLLEQELVLEILLVLAADLEARENAPYNLLVLELMHHLLRGQDPTAVAKSMVEKVSIQQALAREPRKPILSSRHGHFGGTLMIQTTNGKQQYVSASRVGEKRLTAAPLVAKRKHKRTDPFVGNKTSTSADLQHTRSGPAQVKAWGVLNKFCERFFTDCYGAVLKSWKNEFRRDSVRLQQDDLVVLMRIIWFFMQWRRVKEKELGPLIFTMDVFTFNLVLTATDTYTTHKKWPPLATAISLLSEMMHWLFVMYNSKEQTEQIMALGLMDRLFYSSEPLDRLPKLLSKWEPGTSSRKCLSDLVELSYTTLKLLDANAKSCKDFAPTIEKKKEKKKDKTKEAQDTITKMKMAAADFDVNSYFARRLVSNQTVYMYTQLLSQYSSNSAQTNHRILAYLLRLSKFPIHVADPETEHHPLAAKTVTFEPMLYNVQMLMVLDRILNDQSIRKDKKFENLLSFATSFIHRFAKSTQDNPLLFVEALFKHPVPHRFCDLATNLYVSEELRMLAERDLLLEEQRHLEAVGGGNGAAESDDDDDDDDSEEELEFEDFGITAPLKPMAKKRRVGERGGDKEKTKRAMLEDSDDNSESPEPHKAKDPPTKQNRVFDDSSDDEDQEAVAKASAEASMPHAASVDGGESEVDDDSEGKSSSNNDASKAKKPPTFSEDSDSKERNSSPKKIDRRESKRNAFADDSDSEGSESEPSDAASSKVNDTSKSKQPAISKNSDSDSSEDESTSKVSTGYKTRSTLSDDSDSDDHVLSLKNVDKGMQVLAASSEGESDGELENTKSLSNANEASPLRPRNATTSKDDDASDEEAAMNFDSPVNSKRKMRVEGESEDEESSDDENEKSVKKNRLG